MRGAKRYRGRAVGHHDPEDLTAALQSLSAGELRTFVLEALACLDDGPRCQLEDALRRRAASAGSGWKPAAPSAAIIEQVRGFATAARRVGEANPVEVDDYLRHGITAALAGDHAAARAIFAALLIPLADADIDLGQHELVDEVLSVDLHDCVVRYLAAVYATTPSADRAVAVLDAIASVQGLAHLPDPLQELAAAFGGTMPGLDVFLPAWIAHLERDAKPTSEYETDSERWLRAAIGRRDGTVGLERIARSTKRPEAVSAWCDAVVAVGDWTRTLATYEAAAALVTSELWRGEFLDGAALAAQVLGTKDFPAKLEAAWLAAPSLLRLLRWLLVGQPPSATIRKRALTGLAAKPTNAPRIVGFLHVLVGDIEPATQLLTRAPGLGWSSSAHPGHLLFPIFAWLLGGNPSEAVRGGISGVLHRPPIDEIIDGPEADGERPRLPNATVIDALQAADVSQRLTREARALMLTAMQAAASRRTDGVVSEKRRRHYAHAASLVACCLELEEGRVEERAAPAWVDRLRARTARFPAFQEALRVSLAQLRRASAIT